MFVEIPAMSTMLISTSEAFSACVEILLKCKLEEAD